MGPGPRSCPSACAGVMTPVTQLPLSEVAAFSSSSLEEPQDWRAKLALLFPKAGRPAASLGRSFQVAHLGTGAIYAPPGDCGRLTANCRLISGGGGSRTPVRRGLRLEAYMLIPFASCFRPRPSGTSNNGPPTSLSTSRRRSRLRCSGGPPQASPLIDASLRPAGLTKETAT